MGIKDCDILISGGGVAGLTAAAAFGAAGFRLVLTDPSPPVTDAADASADLRTTAFLQPAQQVLQEAGLWQRLGPHATPLQVMAIQDLSGTGPAPRHAFNASDISERPFGWNLQNWLLRREIVAHLADFPDVDFRPGVSTRQVLARDDAARITLSDGTSVAAQLVIAADGRGSQLREAAGIGVRKWRYGQKALAFAATHPIPHENVSTEIHRAGGPFTLVPLPDHDGRPTSAVVWMERGPVALRLAALPEHDFNAAMSERSGHLLGPLSLATRRSIWPIISQIADRFTDARLALIAEAAHVVPPIGAQGLNMSLADIEALLRASYVAPLGSPEMLRRYQRARYMEVHARVLGVDALNRASMSGSASIQRIRAEATRALHQIAPIRRTAMRLGMGHGRVGLRPRCANS
ncbi:MAG: UbiH/UbiF family hydroxylase [Pseudomonadota bacterium]